MQLKDSLKVKMKKVRMLLLDVDGVLTDGGIILCTGGLECKRFDVQDGLGISMVRMAGIKVGIISRRKSEAVEKRAEELHVDVLFQGVSNKLDVYENILVSYDYSDKHVCYVGDDLTDTPLMKRAGVAIAVANAVPEIKRIADGVTRSEGGHGAVREVTDYIIKAVGEWRMVRARINVS